MKHKNLLLSALFMMMGLGASAQNFTATYSKAAAPTFTTAAVEDTVYLYNTGIGGFFINHQGGTGSPYWGTRQSVNDTIGTKVIFTRTNPSSTVTEDSWDSDGYENAYLMVSYVTKFSQFMCAFGDGYSGLWCDNNEQAYRYWNVTCSGNYFTIANTNNPEWAMGAASSDNLCYLQDPENMTETLNTQWAAVAPATYDSYIEDAKATNQQYNAAASLKAAIEKAIAENEGLTLDDQVAVYNSKPTAAELQAAEASIADAVADYVINNISGTADNPGNITNLIQNPTFDTIGDFTGWSSGFGAGGTTGPSAECYGKSFDVYQDLTDLPAGVYRLYCKGYFRKSGAENDVTVWKAGTASESFLYANSTTNGKFASAIQHIAAGAQTASQTTVTSESTVTTDEDGTLYMPNTMAAADYYFHKVDDEGNLTTELTDLYDNEVYVAIEEGDTLRVGVYNTVGGGSDWSIFDDFQLYYYGSENDAYALLAKQTRANATEFDLAETYHGAPELEAYNKLLSDLDAAADKESIIAACTGLSDAATAVQTSIDNYANYIALVEKVNAFLEEGEEKGMAMDQEDVAKLADYIQADEDEGWNFPNGTYVQIIPDEGFEGILSAEGIAAETDSLNAWYNLAMRNALVEGNEVTDLLLNPDFEATNYPYANTTKNYGWLGTDITNWKGGSSTNYAAEAWNMNFDIYQEIELPNGLYMVSVQAFYRTASNATAYEAYQNDPEMTGDAKVLSEVYLNEFSTPVKNVMEIQFDENLADNCYLTPAGTYTLNGMGAASAAFSLEDESQNFTQKVYGLVTDGKMKLGIRNTSGSIFDRWTLWDNFKVTYMGKNTDALAEVIEDYLERAAKLDGETMATADETALSDACTAAEASLTSGDGDTMYDALITLVDEYNDALESIDAYADLAAENEKLVEALETYDETASDEAKDAANVVYSEIEDALANKDLTVEEVEALIEKAESAIADLKIPQGMEDATDDNPVDVTSLIENPTFDENTGWDGSGFTIDTSNGNAEKYNTTFNTYQDIENLPAGTYKVVVNAFYRDGFGDNDYKEYQAGDNSKLTASLYATTAASEAEMTPDNTASTLAGHCAAGGRTDDACGGVNYGTEDSPWYMPNSMTDAAAFFHNQTDADGNAIYPYQIELFVEVGEDGHLRIGVHNNPEGGITSGSWFICDDFELWYYGKESANAQTADDGAVDITKVNNGVSVLSTSIYSTSGARLGTYQKGINIVKQTMADGTVKVTKVMVK